MIAIARIYDVNESPLSLWPRCMKRLGCRLEIPVLIALLRAMRPRTAQLMVVTRWLNYSSGEPVYDPVHP